MSDSISSFVNGVIAGAGIVLALMSYGFLQFVEPLENVQGVTTTELRVAILLGGLVCAVAVGYEFYSKKQKKEKQGETKDLGIEKEKIEKLESRLEHVEKEIQDETHKIQENTQSKDTISKDE